MKKIAILGQGYVGLPLALSFAIHGARVFGVDTDVEYALNLAKGITFQTEEYKGIPIQTILKEQLAAGNYSISTDGEAAVAQADAVIITVGIPVKDGNGIFDYFQNACEMVGKNLKKGCLILIRSTVIPGTTEQMAIPLFEKMSGLKAGEDFFTAYVPERIAEGKAFEEFESMPTVIGAADDQTLKMAQELLRITCKAEIIPTNSIKAAETSKVLENLQRDVNIAMVQEFSRYAEADGIDIFEVIRLANTHKRVNLLTPGPGVGGYCIPNAFHYLNIRAREVGLELPLLQLAREANDRMPRFIVDKILEMFAKLGITPQEGKVAIVGLAMKDYSPDDRLSPALEICAILNENNVPFSAYDPNVAKKYPFKRDKFSDVIDQANILVILNIVDDKFDPIDFIDMMSANPVIIDTRNIVDARRLPKNVIFWKI